MIRKEKQNFNMKEICNPSRTYFYSYIVNVIIAIIFFLFAVFIFAAMEYTYYDYIQNGYGVTEIKIILLHTISIICSLPLLALSLNVLQKNQRIRKILNFGKCYEGTIDSYSIHNIYGNTEISRRGQHKHITLHIQYKMKKTHYCSATGYVRNPNKALSSKQCKIYIYNNTYFVTKFKIRKKNEEKIFIPRDN